MRNSTAFLFLSCLALAGCDPNPEEAAPQCPIPAILPDAATFAVYSPRGHDLTDLVLSGRMLHIAGACRGIQGGHHLRAEAHVEMVVTRGPAATTRVTDVPYFVGVVENGAVVEAPRRLAARVTFPPNTDSVAVRGETVHFNFTLPKGVSGPNYHLYFGFQLTPDQLAENRRRLATSQQQ